MQTLALAGRIKTIQDVVDWNMCTGCGACAFACDRKGVALVNVEGVGIRPRFDDACASCTKCLAICPGYTVDANLATGPRPVMSQADAEFGPALEIWEGHSADPEVRFKASSGGLLTALALYCLERERMAFVVHTGTDPDRPWANQTVQSRTREELLSRTGSRYAPASPCDGLGAIEDADRPCVFIGKPCDATAVELARRERPRLDRNLGLVLTFFCAGTPSTRGTLDLIDAMQVPLETIDEVRYRGEGWPGRFKVLFDDRRKEKSTTYEDSWGRLTHYRSMRCNLCPDGLGRVADLSCGDAWERIGEANDSGRSIVLVRTERGRTILHGAIAAGYVRLERVDADNVLRAQSNLLERRQQLFGRLLGMRLLLVPVPRYLGFSLLASWLRLPLALKARTILGTARRVIQRGLWRRTPIAWDKVSAQ